MTTATVPGATRAQKPSASTSFSVVTTKSNGTQMVFKVCRERREAELIAAGLRNVECPASVEPARATDVAGMPRRRGA